MTLVPGWMWQTMHWLLGMESVNWWAIGWPEQFLGIVGSGEKLVPLVAEAGIRPRMDRRAIVGVDHVAAAASAGTVVAGVVVGAQEIQRRIEQAGLLQPEKNRVRAVGRAQAAVAQARAGRPGSSSGSGMPVSGRNLPPRSKMRRTLPGWEISNCGSGSR